MTRYPGGPDPRVSRSMVSAAAAVARDLLRADDRLAGELHGLAAHRTTDRPPGHGILVDDISEISLTGQLAHGAGHQVRARIRAADGDLVLSNTVPPPGFDDYARQLGLGSVHWIHPGAGPRVCADTLRSADSLGRLIEFTTTRTVYVSPYMASDGAWDLVRELSRATGRAVPMVGPTPAACALANDKSRLMTIAATLLGPASVPAFRVASDAGRAARALASLADGRHMVAVRLPAAGAGLGLHLIGASAAAGLSPAQRRQLIAGFTAQTGHRFPDPLLVVRWYPEVAASPSVHLWIPALGQGWPVCEGVLDQHFSDDAASQFGGGSATVLPRDQQDRVRLMSLRLALVLQRIGYLGRCSFDFILAGPDLARSEPILVECNGRWGGASVILTLVSRLFAHPPQPAFAFGFIVDDRLRKAGFADLTRRLGRHLYSPGKPDGWLIIPHPGSLHDLGRLGCLTVAPTPEQARERLTEELPQVLSTILLALSAAAAGRQRCGGHAMSSPGDNLSAQLGRLRDEYPRIYGCLDPVRIAQWQSAVTSRRAGLDEFGRRASGGRGETYVTAQARSATARARGIRTLIEYLVAGGRNADGVFLDLLGGDGLVRRVAHLIGFSQLDILTCDASPYMVEKAWSGGHPAVLQEAQHPLARTGSLSGVLLAYGTHHIAPEARMTVAREAYRMLKPGGVFVVHDFANDSQTANWFKDVVDKFGHTGHQYQHFSRDEILGYLTGAGFAAGQVIDMDDPFVLSGTSAAAAEGLLAAYLLDMYGLSKAVRLWGTAGAQSWVLHRAREVFQAIPVRKVTESGTPDGPPGNWTAELPRRALAGIGIKPLNKSE